MRIAVRSIVDGMSPTYQLLSRLYLVLTLQTQSVRHGKGGKYASRMSPAGLGKGHGVTQQAKSDMYIENQM